MAKEKEETVAAPVSNAPAIVELENGKSIGIADLQAQLEEAEVGLELGADYFTLEPGESERVVFQEMTEMNGMGDKDGQMVEAVKLLSGKDGRFKINADKVIVSACKALAQKGLNPIGLQITCKGMAKSKNGFKYKDFVINELVFKK